MGQTERDEKMAIYRKPSDINLTRTGNKIKKKHNWFRIIANIVLSLIIVGSSTYMGGLVYAGNKVISEQKETPGKFPSIVTNNNPDVLNFLICGLDNSENLTDIIMVMCYDMKRGTANILQIPRDTFVGSDIPTGKMNAVYGSAKKGESKIRALERRLNSQFQLPIDYYVAITIPGFRKAVRKIGGVEIDMPRSLNLYNSDPKVKAFRRIGPGKVTLNEYQAEGFVRHRASYAQGDLGRVEAQRIFFAGLIKKVKSLGSFKQTSVMLNCMKEFSTDMTVKELTCFIGIAKDLQMYNVLFQGIPGQYIKTRPAGMRQSLSYYSIHKEEYADVLNKYMRPYATTPIYVSDITVPEIYTVYRKSDLDQGGSATDYLGD